MAINSTFYIDAADFTLATAVYLDSLLTNIAPDGFYQADDIVREQSGGILLTAEACGTCATPCGSTIDASGNQGIYLVNLDVGSVATGAIIIGINSFSIPDGIRVTYDGVVYNKLSSPAVGIRQSSTYGNFTVVGRTVSDCGLAGNTTTLPALTEFLYNSVSSSFVPTGNTQSITLLPGDIKLSTSSPGFCVMVIPKTSPTPSAVLIEVVGPCSATSWDIEAYCPEELPSFTTSPQFATSAVPCFGADDGITKYFAKVHLAVDSFVGLYDFVFTDPNGQFPLASGFYRANDRPSPNNVIEVSNGIVVGITNCI